MLRGEHIIAHTSRGRVIPHRLSADERSLAVAGELISGFDRHRNATRGTLDAELTLLEERLGPRLDSRRGFKVVRALAKLLMDRTEWSPPTEADPYHLRTRVFELAARLPELPAEQPGLLEAPTRNDVLDQVARESGLAGPEAVTHAMYADRQRAQVMSEFDAPEEGDLISRYNLAQVQGVLYSARELVVELGSEADAELVFRYAKLMQLIHRVELLEGGAESGYRLTLDGPLSLFGPVRKYGVRISTFLPALLLTTPWRLSAAVTWRDREAALELDSESSGLVTHYRRPQGTRDNDEPTDEVRAAFRKAWERSRETGGWRLQSGSRIIPLPSLGAALVPDFTLVDEGTGELVYLEILGFWTEGHLTDRVQQTRAARERGSRVLVAAPEGLGASPEALDGALSGQVIWFKSRLSPKAVIGAL